MGFDWAPRHLWVGQCVAWFCGAARAAGRDAAAKEAFYGVTFTDTDTPPGGGAGAGSSVDESFINDDDFGAP